MDTNHGFEVCLEAAALTLSVYWWRSPGPGGWHDLPETPAVTGRSGAKIQTPAVSSQGSLWWQAGIYLKICFETLQSWKYLKVHAELAPSWQEGSTAEIIFWGYELGCDKTLMNSLCKPATEVWLPIYELSSIFLTHKIALTIFLLLPGAPEDMARGGSVGLAITTFSDSCLHFCFAYNWDLASFLEFRWIIWWKDCF